MIRWIKNMFAYGRLNKEVESLRVVKERLEKKIVDIAKNMNREVTLASMRTNITDMFKQGYDLNRLRLIVNNSEYNILLNIFDDLGREVKKGKLTTFDSVPLKIKNVSRHYVEVV